MFKNITSEAYKNALESRDFLLENIGRERRRILEFANEMSKCVSAIDIYKERIEELDEMILRYEVAQEIMANKKGGKKGDKHE